MTNVRRIFVHYKVVRMFTIISDVQLFTVFTYFNFLLFLFLSNVALMFICLFSMEIAQHAINTSRIKVETRVYSYIYGPTIDSLPGYSTAQYSFVLHGYSIQYRPGCQPISARYFLSSAPLLGMAGISPRANETLNKELPQNNMHN